MTLIELLIALAIFAVISAITYGAIHTVTETQQRIAARTTRWAALQKAIAVIERDVLQIVDRPIRDEYGESLPALKSSEDDSHLMELTRTGWQTLLGVNQGLRLRRIAYEFDGSRLSRLVWGVLDRAEDSQPQKSILLTEVNAVEIHYLNIDTDDQWLSAWPPESGGGLPRAIKIRLNVMDIGWITRLLALPKGAASVVDQK